MVYVAKALFAIPGGGCDSFENDREGTIPILLKYMKEN
jgi:hypothetical protein